MRTHALRRVRLCACVHAVQAAQCALQRGVGGGRHPRRPRVHQQQGAAPPAASTPDGCAPHVLV